MIPNHTNDWQKRESTRLSRRAILGAGLSLVFINACKAKPVKYTFDVVLFNYLDRPIFEVLIDGRVDANSTPYPDTGGATIADVQLSLGPKEVTWRLDGPEGMIDNGKIVVSKNRPVLTTVPNGKYLGVHIYPDFSVEFVNTVHYPSMSERKREMLKAGMSLN